MKDNIAIAALTAGVSVFLAALVSWAVMQPLISSSEEYIDAAISNVPQIEKSGDASFRQGLNILAARLSVADEEPDTGPKIDYAAIARIGFVIAPAAKLKISLYSGDDPRTLLRGAGLAPWSSPPGTPGKTFISGHNWPTFNKIDRLQIGDEFLLQMSDGSQFTYRVALKEVTDKNDKNHYAGGPKPTGANTVTMMTCWPLDAADTDQRLWVVGERI